MRSSVNLKYSLFSSVTNKSVLQPMPRNLHYHYNGPSVNTKQCSLLLTG